MYRQHVPSFANAEDKYDDMTRDQLRALAKNGALGPRVNGNSKSEAIKRAARKRDAEAKGASTKSVSTKTKTKQSKTSTSNTNDWSLGFCEHYPAVCNFCSDHPNVCGGIAAAGLGTAGVLTYKTIALINAAIFYSKVAIGIGLGTGGIGAAALVYQKRNQIWVKDYEEALPFAEMLYEQLKDEVTRLEKLQCGKFSILTSQETCDKNRKALLVARSVLKNREDVIEENAKAKAAMLDQMQTNLSKEKFKKWFGEGIRIKNWDELNKEQKRALASSLSENGVSEDDITKIQTKRWNALAEDQRDQLAVALIKKALDSSASLRKIILIQRLQRKRVQLKMEEEARMLADFKKNSKAIKLDFDKQNKKIFQKKARNGDLLTADMVIRGAFKDKKKEMALLNAKRNELVTDHVAAVVTWIDLFVRLNEHITQEYESMDQGIVDDFEILLESKYKPADDLLKNVEDDKRVQFMLKIPRKTVEGAIKQTKRLLRKIGIGGVEDQITEADTNQKVSTDFSTKLLDVKEKLEDAIATKPSVTIGRALASLDTVSNIDFVNMITALDTNKNARSLAKQINAFLSVSESNMEEEDIGDSPWLQTSSEVPKKAKKKVKKKKPSGTSVLVRRSRRKKNK